MLNISFNEFKAAVAQLHAANTKHNNMHLPVFQRNRDVVVAYAKSTPNWPKHVTKKQAEDTVPFCLELDKDYYGVCDRLRLHF